jgi:hypothetical protein
MKTQEYHTVVKFPNKITISRKRQNRHRNKHIHARLLSWHVTGTSIKGGAVKGVL